MIYSPSLPMWDETPCVGVHPGSGPHRYIKTRPRTHRLMSASYLAQRGVLCSLHDAVCAHTHHRHTHTCHRQTEGPSGSVGFSVGGTRWQQTDRPHEKTKKDKQGEKRNAALVKNDTHMMTDATGEQIQRETEHKHYTNQTMWIRKKSR